MHHKLTQTYLHLIEHEDAESLSGRPALQVALQQNDGGIGAALAHSELPEPRIDGSDD